MVRHIAVLFVLPLVASVGIEITTEYGPVTGFFSQNVSAFLGIPFAAPPTGDLRWRSPQPPRPWSTSKSCTHAPKSCPQGKGVLSYDGSEDCLTLDVYSPIGSTETSKLPVLFFIHGGSNMYGGSYSDATLGPLSKGMYNGVHLSANRNAVVVSINYRLGILGFLALEELQRESSDGSTGNYGLKDQIFALKWVQNNIAKFGGDPSNVLLFGESAGGGDVCFLLVSEAAKGLFSAVAMESPLCAGKLASEPLPVAMNYGSLWLKKYNCQNVSCLREMSTFHILTPNSVFPNQLPPNPPNAPPLPNGLPLLPWHATIDGVLLKDHPLILTRNGNFTDVPIILGTNEDEGTVFLASLAWAFKELVPLNQHRFEVLVGKFFPSSAIAEIETQYSSSIQGTWDRAFCHLIRDYALACPSRAFMRNIASSRANNKSPMAGKQWMYLFNETIDNFLVEKLFGDMHGAELPWIFDNKLPLIKWTPANQKLSLIMQSYWSSLPSGSPNGDPSCSGCIPWTEYTSVDNSTQGDNYLVLQDNQYITTGLYQQQCDFWDKYGYL